MNLGLDGPGKPTRPEDEAKALFFAKHAGLDKKTAEKVWAKNPQFQKQYLETVKVNADLQAFYEEHGPELLKEYEPKVRIFPSEMLVFCEDETRFLSELEQCHLLLLTANPLEDKMVTRLLYRQNGDSPLRWRVLDNLYRVRLANVGPVRVAHLAPPATGSFSRGGSKSAVECALSHCHPQLVVSLGVAFGADVGKQHLGDVLLSRRLLSCDTNKRIDGKLNLRFEEIYLTQECLIALWGSFLDSKEQLKNTHGFYWHFGSLLSGGSVVSDAEEKLRLIEAAMEKGEAAIGGEMEGTGVYSACYASNTPCIVIKGICDWAVSKNGWAEAAGGNLNNEQFKDCVQAFAVRHAFEALLFLLRAAPVGNMPLLSMDAEISIPPPSEKGKTVPRFCFLDLKEALVENPKKISDEAFLHALLPDDLYPKDIGSVMKGNVPTETVNQFLRNPDLALKHILHKCRLLFQEREATLFFQRINEAMGIIQTQSRAGELCCACYHRCTLGPCHPERGLTILTVFCLLGPREFQNLVPEERDYNFFCQPYPDE